MYFSQKRGHLIVIVIEIAQKEFDIKLERDEMIYVDVSNLIL